MEEPTIKEKLSLLRKNKRNLLKMRGKSVAVNNALETVNDKINYYVELEKKSKNNLTNQK